MKFMRKNGGFTLVELIVVIAILAILAGVAVPAYSGYIKKANEAADNQLLAAVNTAFAAACIENGVPLSSVEDAYIAVTNKVIGAVSGVKAAVGNTAGIPASFATYFSNANPNATFKVFTSLTFDPSTHNFVSELDLVKVAYGDGYFYVSQKVIDKIKESTFGTMGSEALLSQLTDVSGIAQGLMGDGQGKLFDVVGSNMESLALAVGMANAEALEEYLGTQDDGGAAFFANSLVLIAAQNTAGKNAAEATATLSDPQFIANMSAKLNGENPETGLADAALAYGVYTAYMNSQGKGDEVGNVQDFNSLKNALEVMKTDEFQAYLKGEGQKDVEGYLSAMEVVNSTTENSPNELKSALTNGFEDEALKGMMGSLIG